MIIEHEKILELPVLDLHLSGAIGRVVEEIIDPNDLKILGYRVEGPRIEKRKAILLADDIRETSAAGVVIDSMDVLVEEGEAERVDEIVDLGFELVGHKVVTKKGSRLGKVSDFTIDTEAFQIWQLIVKRPPLKAFLDEELVIGRGEIVEVDDEKVVVRHEEAKIKEQNFKQEVAANFVNPFRERRLAEEFREKG